MSKSISVGAKFMKDLVGQNVPNFSSLNKQQREQINLEYRPLDGCDLILYYPGYKEAKGDYAAKLCGTAISHAHVVEALGNVVETEAQALELCNFLLSIYQFGLDAVVPNWLTLNFPMNSNTYTGYEIVSIIYWIVLQEEINYPERGRRLGPRLAFSRYLEAIFFAFYINPEISLLTIKQRAHKDAPRRQVFEDLNITVGLGSELFQQVQSFYKVI